MRKFFLAAFTALALTISLSACSTVSALYTAATTPMDMTTVRKAALSLDATYAGVLDLANTYAALDVCKDGGPVLCASPAVVDKLVSLDAQAKPLVDAMNATAQDPKATASIANAAVIAATNAVGALKAALPAPTLK